MSSPVVVPEQTLSAAHIQLCLDYYLSILFSVYLTSNNINMCLLEVVMGVTSHRMRRFANSYTLVCWRLMSPKREFPMSGVVTAGSCYCYIGKVYGYFTNSSWYVKVFLTDFQKRRSLLHYYTEMCEPISKILWKSSITFEDKINLRRQKRKHFDYTKDDMILKKVTNK